MTEPTGDPTYELYSKALAGTLGSETPTKDPQTITFVNKLGMPVLLYWLSPGCMQCGYDGIARGFREGAPGLTISTGQTIQLSNIGANDYYLVLTAHSGAFVAVVNRLLNPPTSAGLSIDASLLLEPGLVGPVPQPTIERPIPLDSPRVLVGSAKTTDRSIAREQYWRLSPDSYSLPPGEKVSTSVTQLSGMESTSSQQDVMETSLGVSASGGWGPVSASVSSSLSMTSTSFQQVTLNTQTTTFQSTERTNDGDEVVTYFIWQLTEVITVFDGTGSPTASAVSTLQPPVICTPTTPSMLQPHPHRRHTTPDLPPNRSELVSRSDG